MRIFLATAALVATMSTSAAAAVFDFSFSNVNGNTAGEVSGQITLPDGDGTFSATSIVVSDAPGGLGLGTPIDLVALELAGSVFGPTFVQSTGNEFTVTLGQIESAGYGFNILFPAGATNLSAVGINIRSGVSGVSNTAQITTQVQGASNANFVSDTGASTLTFAPANPSPVPLPLPGALLGGLALGAIAVSRFRRQSTPAA